MNDAGGHGGSTAGETSAGLVFISPKFKEHTNEAFKCPTEPENEFTFYDRVEQSDIAATLAALLHFPMPRNSLGRVITWLHRMWNGMYSSVCLCPWSSYC